MGLETGFPGERVIVLPAPFVDLMRDDPLVGDLYLCSMGHITHARHHAVERPDGGDTYVFLYCVWGRGHISVGSHEMVLNANQCVVLPKGVPMAWRSSDDEPWSIYWICFDGDKGKIYAKSMAAPANVLPSIYTRIEQRTELFDKMYAILCDAPTIEKLEYVNQILPHFLASFRYRDHDHATADPPPGYSEGMVGKVLQYMNDNVERRLTMKEIADFAGLSESYFYRRFVQQMSMSPIDYFIRLKINKAAILLLKTSMSISQISAKLGFGSPDYFSRTFRKVLGISATEFRKQDFRL